MRLQLTGHELEPQNIGEAKSVWGGDNRMKVQMTWENEARLLVVCAGELSWDGQDVLVRQLTETLAASDCPRVLLDLEGVDLITSAGLGSLLVVRKLVKERGGRLVLASPSPCVAQVFRTVGLDRHVPMADTVEAGRAMLAKDEACAGSPE